MAIGEKAALIGFPVFVKPDRSASGRGRDADHSAPPAQNRTGGFPAYGSHLGCVTAKRSLGRLAVLGNVGPPQIGLEMREVDAAVKKLGVEGALKVCFSRR